MCREIELTIDKKHMMEVKEILFEFGFSESKSNNYKWFDDELSLSGCHVWMNHEIYGDLNIQGTVSVFRSHEDVEKLIKTMTVLNEEFGGRIIDMDTSELAKLENKIPQYEIIEKKCELVYRSLVTNFEVVHGLIEDAKVFDENPKALRLRYKFNKDLTRNNTLIPFMVSIVESFLKDYLSMYMEYSEVDRNKIYEKHKDVTLNKLRKVFEGKESIVDFALIKYSFQNLDNVKDAYETYANIHIYRDVFDNLDDIDERKVIDHIYELIRRRHTIIHESELYGDLDKRKMMNYYNALKNFCNKLVEVLGEQNGIRVNLLKEILILDKISF